MFSERGALVAGGGTLADLGGPTEREGDGLRNELGEAEFKRRLPGSIGDTRFDCELRIGCTGTGSSMLGLGCCCWEVWYDGQGENSSGRSDCTGNVLSWLGIDVGHCGCCNDSIVEYEGH